MKRKFQRGSGCFKCHDCGKLTRDVGDNGSTGLCPLCYSKSGNGNALSDAGYPGDDWAVFNDCKTPAECDVLYLVELAKLGNTPDPRPLLPTNNDAERPL